MDKIKRKQNYDLLREAGFSSIDATRYKNFTDTKIREFITARKEADKVLSRVHAQVDKTFENIIKGIVK